MSAYPTATMPAPPAAQGSKSARFATRYNRLRAKGRQIQKAIGDDRRKIPYDELGNYRETMVPEYVEGESYTKRELTLMAEVMLREQHLTVLDAHEHPAILLWPMEKQRKKREIYVSTGIPEPSVESGLYWRTHPDGRGVHADDQRAKGASFYK